ncbi:MAG: hypothetical protein ACRC7O_02170 [Fimbriiglobus sp.]
MLPADFDRIERELDVVLPAVYRAALHPFPVPAFAGNVETGLWDDADKLIALNRDRHARHLLGDPAWPRNLFCLGEDAAGGFEMDLFHPDARVAWAEGGHLPDPPEDGDPFFAWLPKYVADLRAELELSGVRPDAGPQTRDEIETLAAIANRRFLLQLVAGGLAVAVTVVGILVILRS